MATPNVAILIVLFLAFVFGILGGAFLVIGISAQQKAHRSLLWPIADGKVVSTNLAEHVSVENEPQRRSVSYEPVIRYEYQIDNQHFSGQRIAFGADSFDYNTAQKVLQRYPVDAAVQVHYDPNDPESAVLETTASGGTLFTVIGIVFLAITGIAILVIIFMGLRLLH